MIKCPNCSEEITMPLHNSDTCKKCNYPIGKRLRFVEHRLCESCGDDYEAEEDDYGLCPICFSMK